MILLRRTAVFAVATACFLFPSNSICLASTGQVAWNGEPSVEVPAHMVENLSRGCISQSRETMSGKNFHVARATVNATPDQVWSVLTDYDHATTTVPHLKDIKILSTEKNHKRIWFSVASLGGLYKLDYTLKITESKPHRLEWRRESGAFKTNEGFWRLQPIQNGTKTLVTYAKYVDGGILIPQVFVDGQLKKTMPEIIQSIRTAVTDAEHDKIAER
ncbi:MAG: SRPBCC family protein [Cyanobacteria bacterium]|nr:SRPBCC family protein [Cyanobacteriota bacterium]